MRIKPVDIRKPWQRNNRKYYNKSAVIMNQKSFQML